MKSQRHPDTSFSSPSSSDGGEREFVRKSRTKAATNRKKRAVEAEKAAKDSATRSKLNAGEHAFKSFGRAIERGTVGGGQATIRAAAKTHLGDVRAKRQRLRETLG